MPQSPKGINSYSSLTTDSGKSLITNAYLSMLNPYSVRHILCFLVKSNIFSCNQVINEKMFINCMILRKSRNPRGGCITL